MSRHVRRVANAIDHSIATLLSNAEARRSRAADVAHSAAYGVLASKRRRCAYHFRSLPRAMLVRFARGVDATTGAPAVVADTRLRLPGRGTWLLACRGTIVDAVATRRLQHAVLGGAARGQPEFDGEALVDSIAADLRARFWEVVERADEVGCVVRGDGITSTPSDGTAAAPNLLVGPRGASRDALRALRAAAERGGPPHAAHRVAMLPERAVWGGDVPSRFVATEAFGVHGGTVPLLYLLAMQLVGLDTVDSSTTSSVVVADRKEHDLPAPETYGITSGALRLEDLKANPCDPTAPVEHFGAIPVGPVTPSTRPSRKYDLTIEVAKKRGPLRLPQQQQQRRRKEAEQRRQGVGGGSQGGQRGAVRGRRGAPVVRGSGGRRSSS